MSTNKKEHRPFLTFFEYEYPVYESLSTITLEILLKSAMNIELLGMYEEEEYMEAKELYNPSLLLMSYGYLSLNKIFTERNSKEEYIKLGDILRNFQEKDDEGENPFIYLIEEIIELLGIPDIEEQILIDSANNGRSDIFYALAYLEFPFPNGKFDILDEISFTSFESIIQFTEGLICGGYPLSFRKKKYLEELADAIKQIYDYDEGKQRKDKTNFSKNLIDLGYYLKELGFTLDEVQDTIIKELENRKGNESTQFLNIFR